ncbi:MAG: sodium:solute symporter family protein [Bryobacterales bacterium]|nr:sodium:solute symporter family protein [Bryobacterales bacterium]
MTSLVIMAGYLSLLVGLGMAANRVFRGTAADYFMASHSIGPVLLMMSLFGTTMTAFALVGSTGEAYRVGIGVYGMLASWSGLVHVGVFFFIGIRLWAIGKRYGYVTQVQYFRARFDSDLLGLILFPILVALVIPYLLIGLLGAGGVVQSLTQGAFPGAFAATNGGLPPWLTGLIISCAVLSYVFFGGLRGAAWANTFQTAVFMLTGLLAFWLISSQLGGLAAASRQVFESHPERLMRTGSVTQLQFFTYFFIPLSVGMFPHVFQHWLTARSAKTFRLSIVMHPIFILIVWAPCVLIGVWATSATLPDGSLIVPPGSPRNTELATMVHTLTTPVIAGLLGAGILAAIMSSLDSQFFCLGTMFTTDIVAHYFGEGRFGDRRRVLLGRSFIVAIVAITYLLSLTEPRQVFPVGVWCFTGFAGLFPLVCGALYWRRCTKTGAIASIAAAAVAWALLFRASGYGVDGSYLFLGMLPVATVFTVSLVTLVGVSLVTAVPSEATLHKFFPPANIAAHLPMETAAPATDQGERP